MKFKADGRRIDRNGMITNDLEYKVITEMGDIGMVERNGSRWAAYYYHEEHLLLALPFAFRTRKDAGEYLDIFWRLGKSYEKGKRSH